MAIDAASGAENQARVLRQKKKDVEDEISGLITEKARVATQKSKEISRINEKNDADLVAISKAGEKQADQVKKLNSDRVKVLNETSQKSYDEIAQNTADRIRSLNSEALKTIEDHRAANMDRIKFVTSQSEDPFYRMKSLGAVTTESETGYLIKLNLPEHEAKNLFVAGEGTNVKVSLSRRFQEKAQEAEKTVNTSSYQTLVESIYLNHEFDPRGIRKEFADGVVTISVPKVIRKPPGKPEGTA